MRTISNALYTDNTKPRFKSLEILNIWYLFEHQFGNFVFDFDNGNLPDAFDSLFVKSMIHMHIIPDLQVRVNSQ